MCKKGKDMLFMFGFGGLACSMLEFSLSDALNVPGKLRVCSFIKQERNSRRTAGMYLKGSYLPCSGPWVQQSIISHA